MKEHSGVILLYIALILNGLNFILCSNPAVSTASGSLKGSILETWTNKKIFSFRGVPFAEPPVGNLRFKAPVPVKSWVGVKNAIDDGKVCPQIGKNVGPKDEDCLFLNIYSKDLKGNQPVIVFFHPGAFYSFTGASYWFGPDYLLDHDVVLVTVNYRLDALGFLSTGDHAAPGNNGLKDQVLALRWVKENIKKFGGNPGEVTIAGYSAGSRSVLLHLFSPMTKDLFHRAIAMSAGVTGNMVVTKDPVNRARKLAGLLNCRTNSTRRLVECLRNFPADDITSKFNQMRIFAGRPTVVFGPVIEPDLGNGEERFLTDYPINLLKKKQFHQVPVVTGICDREFVGWGIYVLNNETLTKQLNKEFDSLVPAIFAYNNKKIEDVQKITNSLKQFYFGNGPITKTHIAALSNMYSDYSIIHPVYTTAKLLAKYSDKPVYFYKLNYEGRYGWAKDPETNKTVGPSHHDDLNYLFYISKKFPRFTKSDPEAFMVGIETSFWKNFATKGNPTPDGISFQWTPLSEKNKKYLIINTASKMENGFPPFADRMNLWESLLPIEDNF